MTFFPVIEGKKISLPLWQYKFYKKIFVSSCFPFENGSDYSYGPVRIAWIGYSYGFVQY